MRGEVGVVGREEPGEGHWEEITGEIGDEVLEMSCVRGGEVGIVEVMVIVEGTEELS